jgi:predicted HAD superfamily Cof-like phosphohydrolase
MPNLIGDVNKFLYACGQSVMANNPEQAALYLNLIKEEYQELLEAVDANDDTEILDAIFDTIWVCIGYAKSRGWDLDEAWKEGAQSNLSKIDPTTGHVQRREDGKIMKPEGWLPPNFKPFV